MFSIVNIPLLSIKIIRGDWKKKITELGNCLVLNNCTTFQIHRFIPLVRSPKKNILRQNNLFLEKKKKKKKGASEREREILACVSCVNRFVFLVTIPTVVVFFFFASTFFFSVFVLNYSTFHLLIPFV